MPVRAQSGSSPPAVEVPREVPSEATDAGYPLATKIVMAAVAVCVGVIAVNVVVAVANAVIQTAVYVVAAAVIAGAVCYYKSGSEGLSGLVFQCTEKVMELKNYLLSCITSSMILES